MKHEDMKRIRPGFFMFHVFMFHVFSCAFAARAEIGPHPYPPVVYQFEKTSNPEHQIFIAQIDLTDKRVQVRVAASGPDPDGPSGKWETVLAPPTKTAERENFDVVINGDFFSI